MSVGEGIFCGALVLGLIGLYAATKDRWKWRRIAKWGLGLPVALLAISAAGIWATKTYEARSQAQTAFGGLTLASTEGDVRFAKGEPSKVLGDGLWVYYAGSGSANLESAGYVVRFKDGKVRYIRYVATPDQIVTPGLQGLSIGTSYDQVLEKLGPASHVATSDDGLLRRLSYEKLNSFYTFEKARVMDFGVYDPATGPFEFSKKTAMTPASAPSAPTPSAHSRQDAAESKPILDHCAPGLAKADRLKRLAQHGTVRQTGAGEFQAGGRKLVYLGDGKELYCCD